MNRAETKVGFNDPTFLINKEVVKQIKDTLGITEL